MQLWYREPGLVITFQLADQPGYRSWPTEADNGDGHRWIDVGVEHLHRQRRAPACGGCLLWGGVHPAASGRRSGQPSQRSKPTRVATGEPHLINSNSE